jgi:hypothetical protein
MLGNIRGGGPWRVRCTSIERQKAALTNEDHMAYKNAVRRSSIAFAMLTCLLAIPRGAWAGDDAGARAAAASDPEYGAGYSSPVHSAVVAGDCKDKPYAVREEFTACQDQALERTYGAAHGGLGRLHLTAAAPRKE